MPDWRELDRLIEEMAEPVAVPADAPMDAEDEWRMIRESVLHMFETVAEVCNKLRSAGVFVPGTRGRCEPFPSYADVMRIVSSAPSPAFSYWLDPWSRIDIRVSTRRGFAYPEMITTAKWRCVYTVNGDEFENILCDNRNVMAEWLITHVREFQRLPLPLPPPLPVSEDPAPTAVARENRIIMVDDPGE